jgi:hypothetical protein
VEEQPLGVAVGGVRITVFHRVAVRFGLHGRRWCRGRLSGACATAHARRHQKQI